MKQKMKTWVKRYLPAEILSIIITLVAAGIAHWLYNNGVITALAGTWGGNIAYFGYIFTVDVLQSKKELHTIGLSYSKRAFAKNIRMLVVEFGIAELVDSLVIRPALMYYFPIWLNNLSLGILLAKIAADITFYIPAIISFELQKAYAKNPKGKLTGK